MDLNSKVAARIKELREKKNLAQAKFAAKLGLSDSAFSRLENGETQICVNTLQKIAEHLEVEIGTLLSLTTGQINNFNNNGIVQHTANTLNISLSPEEFNKVWKAVQSQHLE